MGQCNTEFAQQEMTIVGCHAALLVIYKLSKTLHSVTVHLTFSELTTIASNQLTTKLHMDGQ